MRTKTLLCSLLLAITINAPAGDEFPPDIQDMSQLHLTVSGTQVMDSVGDFMSGYLYGSEEKNLIVVTLSGTCQAPCSVGLNANDFTAITSTSFGFSGPSSLGVSLAWPKYSGTWSFVNRNGEGNTTIGVQRTPVREAGPVTIKVAFLLDKTVKDFFVAYPALANKQVIVPQKEK